MTRDSGTLTFFISCATNKCRFENSKRQKLFDFLERFFGSLKKYLN